ncbi:TauD/TfdA family dioxygenase [Legionella sainthelensi]|uniref:TauD/TfdA family dioxygenase n=1 Tax=Legionella sainthelensi TaxID=28087 RepID=UPI000E1FBB3C|nr:TauD/TfdA family dioxygenase [Legionella sainthelensi]
MHKEYQGVITRFLRKDERLILSEEEQMPLVIEADKAADLEFLQQLLKSYSHQIIQDMAQYGAVLLRGFNIDTEEQFENIILSIPEFRGISDAFMSENGRVHVGDLKYVLHTNSIYKTGGTLYLGGFHTENYYSTDVPSYLCFCCFQPSAVGGETGLINTQKIYNHLSKELKEKLEKRSFFVCQWSIKEIAERYQISEDEAQKKCERFALPIEGEGSESFAVMYKPSVLEHPLTQEKALQINLFELAALNYELRKCFMNDYKGKKWFWHRFFWKLPTPIFNSIEFLAILFISFFNSPKNSYKILRTKFYTFKAKRKNKLKSSNKKKVGGCFSHQEVKALAHTMRRYYSSCIWKKGDVLLIDNKKVMHAGMPGLGPRLIRAMICNPLAMNYYSSASGTLVATERETETLGASMTVKPTD